MSATVVREKRQVTLPEEVIQAARIKADDQVDWRFEDGEIRGKKLVPETVRVLDLEDLDPKTLAPKEGKPTRESIIKAVRADREAFKGDTHQRMRKSRAQRQELPRK